MGATKIFCQRRAALFALLACVVLRMWIVDNKKTYVHGRLKKRNFPFDINQRLMRAHANGLGIHRALAKCQNVRIKCWSSCSECGCFSNLTPGPINLEVNGRFRFLSLSLTHSLFARTQGVWCVLYSFALGIRGNAPWDNSSSGRLICSAYIFIGLKAKSWPQTRREMETPHRETHALGSAHHIISPR